MYLASCITEDMYFVVKFWTELKVVFQSINLFKQFGILTKFSKTQDTNALLAITANHKHLYCRVQVLF